MLTPATRAASAVSKRMSSAARSARASASSRELAAWRARSPARSAPRRSGAEDASRAAVDARVEHAFRRRARPRCPRRPPASPSRRRRGSARRRRRRGFGLRNLDGLAERRGEREAVEVDPERGVAELGVVAAADARRELHHLRPVGPEHDLRVRRAVRDPERLGGRPRPPRPPLPRRRARPGVRERDPEGRRRRR